MKVKNLVLISFLSFILIEILFSCAQIVAPTGGKKDTLAPVIVKTFPNNQATNFSGKLIQLEFNEYVTVDNIQQQLLITPNIEGAYQTKPLPKGVRLTFDKPFKPNTTYSLNFRNAIKDITERNIAKNIRLVFSTGKIIDSLIVSGKVFNPQINKPILDMTVGLYTYSDTLNPKKEKPYYFTKTDSSGIFKIENVASGKYRIYAIADANNNLLYEEAKELMGFVKDTIDLKSNLSNLEINMAKMDKSPNKVAKTRNTANYYYIEYSKGIKNVKIDFLGRKDTLAYQQIDSKNLRIYNTINNSTDTVKVKVSVTDSLDRVFTHDQKIKFRVKGKKDESVKEEFSTKITPTNNEDIDLKDVGYTINFSKPIIQYDISKIEIMNDTLIRIPITEKDITWSQGKTKLHIQKNDKKPKEFVRVRIPKGTFISLENDTTSNIESFHPIRDPENYGIIEGEVKNPNKKHFIIQLLNERNEVVQKVDNVLKYEFAFLKAGIYYVRLIVDENQNSRWDEGDWQTNTLPERIIYNPNKIKLKQNFVLSGNDFTID
ncbi:Ig-like domain-containing domain [Arcicella aquatica]|uniref:Ig-like domain-containing domain n=1 Tax=Arcicella aquatica TaxID=217141 RepID=A0ABU5QNH5_9BACT|nr:Ig-like domain-containing domain [Arcicella aquatica]MEA5258613.1 Ig-like domain-containing domain [Arcicella aquatica]